MRLRVVAHVVGLLLRAFGLAFFAPLLVDWAYGNWAASIGFALGALAAVTTGEIGRRLSPRGIELNRLEGIAVVASTWLVVSIFAAIPYLWNGLSVIDSLFESMSGLTTTGATIFTDFSRYEEGLYLWRSMTQWFGGMGVIALFIAVLPKLALAGRQMFFAEAPGPEEDRLTPRIRQTAIALWALYVGLTAVESVLLTISGMPLFDAVCNSMTTMAAGGFSPHSASIGGYGSASAEWIIIGFMFLAGANYSLQYRALRGQPGTLLRDEEFRVYAGIVLVSGLALSAVLLSFSRDLPPEYAAADTGLFALAGAGPFDALRQGFFQVLTIITTTGFASDDFNLWNDQAKVLLLVLMFVGGCAGSAGGGPKVVRVLLVWKYATGELIKALHPQAVKPVRYNARVVPPKVLRAIVSFMLLYLLIFALSVVALTQLGSDLMTAITASIATLGNIGPGFGAVGPMSDDRPRTAAARRLAGIALGVSHGPAPVRQPATRRHRPLHRRDAGRFERRRGAGGNTGGNAPGAHRRGAAGPARRAHRRGPGSGGAAAGGDSVETRTRRPENARPRRPGRP
jgi:trk system potassium uptake protein TrkH